jgi:hypothetical protein
MNEGSMFIQAVNSPDQGFPAIIIAVAYVYVKGRAIA